MYIIYNMYYDISDLKIDTCVNKCEHVYRDWL